jgi:hypothetical protein
MTPKSDGGYSEMLTTRAIRLIPSLFELNVGKVASRKFDSPEH